MLMRTPLLVLLFVFCGAASRLFAQDPKPAQDTPEQQILLLETVWNEAHLHGDVDALDRLWAPDISVIVPEMQPFTKEQLLKMWRSMQVIFTSYATSNLRVHCDGSTAVVTGRLQRRRDFGGRTRSEDWLFTKTYAQVAGQWKVVAYHASATPAP
jgi:ketosteroid isomerase-like protein